MMARFLRNVIYKGVKYESGKVYDLKKLSKADIETLKQYFEPVKTKQKNEPENKNEG